MKARKDADPGSRDRKVKAAIQHHREARRDKLARREERLRDKIEARQRQTGQLDPDGDGLAVVDGKLVVTWIARDILEARKRGLLPSWVKVISGYRTPAYSISICISICGAPVCPGRCAGASSRHAQKGQGNGAVDVTLGGQEEFAAAMRAIGSPLHNSIGPSDPNHFSAQGN